MNFRPAYNGQMKISELKGFQDRRVILKLADGETLRAFISFVDAEYEDIILDTDKPENYKTSGAAYSFVAFTPVGSEHNQHTVGF